MFFPFTSFSLSSVTSLHFFPLPSHIPFSLFHTFHSPSYSPPLLLLNLLFPLYHYIFSSISFHPYVPLLLPLLTLSLIFPFISFPLPITKSTSPPSIQLKTVTGAPWYTTPLYTPWFNCNLQTEEDEFNHGGVGKRKTYNEATCCTHLISSLYVSVPLQRKESIRYTYARERWFHFTPVAKR